MNADQTYNSIVFKKSYDNKDESVRQSIIRGMNTPDILTIKSQNYTDSKTKISGRRHVVRLDRTDMNGGATAQTNAAVYVVLQVPSDYPDEMSTLLTTFRALVASSGTLEAVLNEEK